MKTLLCVLLIGIVLAALTGCDEWALLERFLPGYGELYYYPGESCCDYVVETYEQEQFRLEETYHDEVWIDNGWYSWP